MKKVGVIRGGISPEYLFSIDTGAEVIRALGESGYEAIDLFLDKDGVLHVWGVPTTLEELPRKVDMIWNALHGEFGEDGRLQQMLHSLAIPYVGPDATTAALFHHKEHAKNLVKESNADVKVPPSMLLFPEDGMSVSEVTQSVYKKMAPPWVIKPLTGGASVNTFFIKTPLELAHYVDEAISRSEPFMVEQYVYGKEVAVPVMNDFRDQEVYAFPPVEMHSAQNAIHTHEDRNQEEKSSVSGTLSLDQRKQLEAIAKDIHKKNNLGDFSQIEFILDTRGGVWFIEADTVPHLHPQSPFRKALEAVGGTLKELVHSLVSRKK
jgi:D-alanine-D-alanine ligase